MNKADELLAAIEKEIMNHPWACFCTNHIVVQIIRRQREVIEGLEAERDLAISVQTAMDLNMGQLEQERDKYKAQAEFPCSGGMEDWKAKLKAIYTAQDGKPEGQPRQG